MEARTGVGHGAVDVKPESIMEETIKQSVCHREIHICMKQTSLEITNWINWGLEKVSDVGWMIVSWTTTS